MNVDRWISFDALLFINEQGRWANFVNGGCEVKLVQSKMNYTLYCSQQGRTVYQCSVTPAVAVKRMDADFLQFANNAGSDRILLGMKFRSEADTNNFMAALEQCIAPGYTSMPANRQFHANQQSEFATVAGGNYRGGPNIRNQPQFYPREQSDQKQSYTQRQYQPEYDPIQQQPPVRGGAQMPAPPQGRVQEVKRLKPVIKSKQELERYVELLGVALTDNDDTDFAKSVVNLLVEARKNQQNFAVKFLPDGARTYFRLCVKIEREMIPEDHPITYYLLVAEDFTIKHLRDMIELKFSISGSQQHWIIGNEFVNNTDATLKSFGVKSKGAEVYLFISKGEMAGDVSSVDDDIATTNSHQQEWHQPQQQGYDQQPSQLHQNQRLPEQQYYHQQQHQNQQQHQQLNQHQNQHQQLHQNQHQNQHQQQQLHLQQHGQYNQYTNQSYSQQQQFNSNITCHSQNHTYGVQRVEHQYYGNPVSPDGTRRTISYQPVNVMPQAVVKQPEKPVRPPTPPKIGWPCPKCTVINEPYRPGCEVCGENRPEDYRPPAGYTPTRDEVKWLQDEMSEKLHLVEYEREEKRQQEDQARKNYQALLDVANQNLIPNDEKFDCPICFGEFDVGEGVKLRECFHCCCKDCLHDHIMGCRDADVKCPCNVNDEVTCKGSITEAEMRSLLTEEELGKVHNRGLVLAEGQAKSYHCKTADCRGFCFYEDEVNNFDCPVCNKRNCLLCKAIHYPEMNCKEYQEDLRIKAANDKAAQETQKMLEDMITNGEAMYCPNDNCRLIIQKKDGCDWIQCSCGTEICWVTKGPRWGPGGNGDTSGGCKCDFFAGRPCHPNCRCCH